MTTEQLRRRENVRQTIEEYTSLGSKFENPPQVSLEIRSVALPDEEVGARDIAVSTAYQCYAPGITKIALRRDEKSEENAENTLRAGHLTTRQHANFTWKLIGVSRAMVHDILHFSPFYNTSQQSQRYVEAKAGNYLVPVFLTDQQKDVYTKIADFSNGSYFELLELVRPRVEERIHAMYPVAGWRVEETAKRLGEKVPKLCQEVARYVLPIAQRTTLDYTLSELQLIRLFKISGNYNFSNEARVVIGRMVEEVAKVDPTILGELKIPSPEGPRPSLDEVTIRKGKDDFDKVLGAERNSLLLTPSPQTRDALVWSVRNILGDPDLNEEEALKKLLDPQKNILLADVLATGMLDPLTSILRQASITYLTRISHTGDSQRQRQRMTSGATPSLEALYSGDPDYQTPLVIQEDEKLRGHYSLIIERMFENVKEAIAMGIPEEYALLLLPNALTVRLTETGTLFDWFIRWKERLCYRAQEEIFFVSVDQVDQFLQSLPEASKMLQAKCGVRKRAGVSPRCPEGTYWCGQPVFNWDIDRYKKERLI